MIDALAATLAGVANDSTRGLPAALLAGVATSIGPCVAPRYLALAALIGGQRPFVPIVAFTGGIMVAYVAVGSAAGIVGSIVSNASIVDLAMAVALTGCGIATLWHEPHACVHDTRHIAPRRASGAFALGAGSALVISPCCTPLIVGFAGLGAFERDPLLAAAYLGTFALGHAAPLALTGGLGATFARRVRGIAASAAPGIVSGTLMIALGCYYGLLA